jgi:hypothetical protein
MKIWNLDPPVTVEELEMADALYYTWTAANGKYLRFLGDAGIDRARRVMIELQSPKEVAEADGITYSHVYNGLNRALRAVIKLRNGGCRNRGNVDLG